jgi:hypothetical protein
VHSAVRLHLTLARKSKGSSERPVDAVVQGSNVQTALARNGIFSNLDLPLGRTGASYRKAISRAFGERQTQRFPKNVVSIVSPSM